jgi:hypothetical protein
VQPSYPHSWVLNCWNRFVSTDLIDTSPNHWPYVLLWQLWDGPSVPILYACTVLVAQVSVSAVKWILVFKILSQYDHQRSSTRPIHILWVKDITFRNLLHSPRNTSSTQLYTAFLHLQNWNELVNDCTKWCLFIQRANNYMPVPTLVSNNYITGLDKH